MNSVPKRKMGFYERYIKRILDIICSLFAFIFLWWLFLIIAVMVKVRLGSPVLFKQPRPGLIGRDGQERVFMMYKFRTMTDDRGKDGELLPDKDRITRFGKWLRRSSLDELPEIINILKGDMSVIGPRPQLVRDMVFMSDRQRMRHTAKPGLSGLAQVNGRNGISWEEKIEWDLKYIKRVQFCSDLKLVLKTMKKVFGCGGSRETDKEVDISLDYGDALLESGKISKMKYDELQVYAKDLIMDMQQKKVS